MIILPCGLFSYFSCVNFFCSFGEDEDPTLNQSSDDSEQNYDKHEPSTTGVKMFPHCRSPAEESSDPLDGTYDAAEDVAITRMYVSHLCPIFPELYLILERGLFPF
jgi:hypothetical protein